MAYKWNPLELGNWLEDNEEYITDWIQQHEVSPADPNILVQKVQTGDMYGEIEDGNFTGGFTLMVLWSSGQNTVHKVRVDAKVESGYE